MFDTRQVPEEKVQTQNHVLLIGDGRLAKHLLHWNSLQDEPSNIITWSRKQNNFNQLKEKLAIADIVWLAISDQALIPFYNNELTLFTKTIVHFSGAMDAPPMISAHPLMSFPEKLMENRVYEKIHFTLSGASSLEKALPNFKNKFSILNSELKPLYHSLCVVSGNFPIYLWLEVLKELENLQIPASAFFTYIEQVSHNFIFQQKNSLTGPILRNDLETIEKNLSALKKQNLSLFSIYEKFYLEFKK